MEWHIFLVAIHLIGAVFGVGAATFAEIFLIKALRDGEIDPVESSFMQVSYSVIRIGLALSILSGFALLIGYRLEGAEELLFDNMLWAKISIICIILINAILLQTRKIPLWLGSALSFASWYSALLIIPVSEALNSFSYLGMMGLYIVIVAIVAVCLNFIRGMFGVKI